MFNVGDLVTVRHHTKEEKEQYPYIWTIGMDEMEGNTYRIWSVGDDYCVIKEPEFGLRRMFIFDSVHFTYEQF